MESEINQCNERITKQKKEYLLEELRHYIKDGEKCPLCGNIHPSYVFFNKEEALGASLKDKTNELNALKEKQQYVSQTVLLLQASLSGKEKELSSDEIIETSLPADIGTWIEDKKTNLSDMLTAFSEQCLKCTSMNASMKEVKDQLKKSALKLSGGQKQRLAIARSLCVNPEILLLDEPCSALDMKNTIAIEETLMELKGQYTFVIVTHNLGQAKRIADQIIFMDQGKILEVTDKETFFDSPATELAREQIQYM